MTNKAADISTYSMIGMPYLRRMFAVLVHYQVKIDLQYVYKLGIL